MRQRLGIRSSVHEYERSPGIDGNRAETELALVEVRELFRARRRAQRAVEAIRPRVIRTMQRLALAGSLHDPEPSVATDVQEGAQLAVARARHGNGRTARPRREKRSGTRHLSEVARVLPGGAEDLLLLPPQDLGIDVPAVRERFLHSPNLPAYDGWREDGAATLLLLQSSPTSRDHDPAGDSGRLLRLGRLGDARLLQGRGERPAERESSALRARVCGARGLLPRFRLRLDADPRRLGYPHLVSGGAARGDGLGAREIRAGRSLDACGARPRRSKSRRHGCRARDRFDPRP